ncbi:MFS transporter [Dyella choica]|uniref:DHA2 family efflux MFS transporter permease subunit n=1 Tax=Dyella choica TaxID=1927959 RepID=A0A3S0Q4S1_9GAMM|nr:MFS transporter [Dyella choica]RUL75930.1 DHA2 family efflux MFS transporter permease subunit [Dyella choica]
MSQIGKPPCEEGVILGGAQALPCSAPSRHWTLVAAILGSSLAFIDGTVVNVALPAIQRELGASTSDAQWVMESYALFLASLLLVGGTLGDRFGRKRIFMLGAGLFMLASIGCSLSSGVLQLIAARAFQGIGAALLVPGSLALISATFPQSERGAAIGTWSAFSGITAAIGPVIGGFLVEHYSWTWAFLINAPVGVVLLAICAAKVPESKGRMEGPVDVLGASLVTIGLAGLVFAFIEAPARGWTAAPIWLAAVIGILALLLFVRVEAHAASPMLPLALFRERNFAGANLLTLLLYAALGGSLFFLPLNLIQVQGYGATAAGAALLPFIAIMFLLSRWTGSLVDRFGSRLPLVIGPTIAAAGFAMFALPATESSYWTAFFPAICILGLGMSVTVAPLTTTVMNLAGRDLAGTASGINNAVSRAAALLAIALFGFVLTLVFNIVLDSELRSLRAPTGLVAAVVGQRQKLAGIVMPAGYPDATLAALKHAVNLSFLSGFRCVMLVSAALALLSAASAWIFIEGRQAAHGVPVSGRNG